VNDKKEYFSNLPLTNETMKKGYFLMHLKRARVIPNFKKGDTTKLDNYYPATSSFKSSRENR
jgi:hypothetical protein